VFSLALPGIQQKDRPEAVFLSRYDLGRSKNLVAQQGQSNS
jgi:hypothetical protein